jgi:rhamnogalacturonan endolyase
MHSADVDGDGRDEVVLGSAVLDDNGTCLWSAGLGHPDKCFVTQVDPRLPGMQIFYAIEPGHDEGTGVCLVDARTGKMIWSIGRPTKHVGDGMVADIDPSVPGLECFASEDSKGGSSDRYLLSAAGKPLGTMDDVPPCRNWVFWDGDLLREMVVGGGRGRGGAIAKYKGPTLTPGIEGSVAMIADLLGDWREEVIMVLRGELRIYTTTLPAKDRRVCLMQDPVYRADVAHRSQGYDQSPVTGYYLGVPAADAAKATPTIPRAEK